MSPYKKKRQDKLMQDDSVQSEVRGWTHTKWSELFEVGPLSSSFSSKLSIVEMSGCSFVSLHDLQLPTQFFSVYNGRYVYWHFCITTIWNTAETSYLQFIVPLLLAFEVMQIPRMTAVYGVSCSPQPKFCLTPNLTRSFCFFADHSSSSSTILTALWQRNEEYVIHWDGWPKSSKIRQFLPVKKKLLNPLDVLKNG